MPLQRQDRVSLFKEAPMQEVDAPSLTSRSSYSARTEKSVKLPSFNYKPLILRSYSLLSLVAVTLAFIGLLELAVVQLPHGSTHFGPQNVTSSNSRRDVEHIFPRNATAAESGPTLISSSSTSSSTSSSATLITSTSTTTTSTTTDASIPSTASTPSSIDTSTEVPTLASSTPTSVPSSTTEDASTTVTPSSPSSTYITPLTITPTPTPTSVVTPSTSSSSEPSTQVTQEVMPSSAYLSTVQTITSTSSETLAYNTGDKTAYVPNATSKPTSGGKNTTSDGGDTNQTYYGQEDRQQPEYRIWSAGDTFLGTYMTVLIAVIYRIIWMVIHSNFNVIDPFRQLMGPDGASAEEAFFAFYQSHSNLLGPIPALTRRRWALALVAATYLIACLLPALASESVFVDTDWKCPSFDPDNSNNPCPPRTTVNVAVVRALQAFLAIAAAVLLFITSLILFRNTGLPADPRSIATIASLMRHPSLIEDLNHVPVNASSKDMQIVLQGKMYRLGSFRSANGEYAYGIRPADGSDDVDHTILSTTDAHKYTPVEGSFPFSDRESSSLHRFRIQDLILALVVLGSFGVVLAYYLDAKNDGFNRFFESNTFGPRFIITLAGTIVATLWKSVEQSSVVMAPYLRLAKQTSSSGSTILFEPSSTPVSSTFKTIRHRYDAVALITVITLLAEALNIVIAGVPYATGETWMQFRVSAYMSIGILGVMIIVVALVIFSRMREPRIPRNPGTLGAVMSYMSGSRMLDDFQGTENLDKDTRNRMIRQRGKKYEFRETVRKDGKYAWTVDEAPGPPMYHS